MDQHAEATGRTPDDERLVCARCGATADGPRPTWTFSMEDGRRRYFCDSCSREHLRAIEGRLDSSWW
ncbi:hypothetical protein [Streptomyces indicus]|uniref:Uncharacterized protein n=1 Tax=Streptomyces indicus TaxID=417292 RepID=A0A1G9FTL3_9ACTN|nr:hypothetical protein [Streptomyces indicus]SDK91734.1 hypothetical protein SAMN05421806_11455 [Streptomyces indicus]